MARTRVLVIDDKENMLKLFAKILEGGAYELTTSGDGQEGLRQLATQPFDVVVSDIRMPGADGFDILRASKKLSPDTEVVLMTAYASVQAAVEAIKEGAYDYLQKPFDPEDAERVIARAAERKQLREQAARLRREVQQTYGFDRLVGKSPPMRDAYDLLARAAELDITVLIMGESGTGKELAARAVHYRSARREGPFVPVNCGALPAELVESELFGHTRGAFTGAASARGGLFLEAGGGTLFLDEIGDLPLPAQVKLTRALQEKEIRAVGSSKATHVNVRVIAATHRDLKEEVREERFREDLYYRLNVYPVPLPPLRERQEDIPLLAGHFLDKYAGMHQRETEGFEPEALQALTSYAWPGNVRELENAIERAVVISNGRLLGLESLPAEVRGEQEALPLAELLVKSDYRGAMDLARDRASHEYLRALMMEFGGNVTRAAERAGMQRESLHRLLKRYGIRSDEFKEAGG